MENKLKVVEIDSWNKDTVRTKLIKDKACSRLYRKYSNKEAFDREIAVCTQLKDSGTVLEITKIDVSDSAFKVFFNLTQLKPLKEILSGLKKSEKRVLITNIVLALDKLHKRKLIHRNLKTEHIFVDLQLNVKFGGLESAISEQELGSLYGVMLSENFENNTLIDIMPSEVTQMILGFPITTQVDIWSLGFIIHEIIFNNEIPKNQSISRFELTEKEPFWNNFLNKVFVSNPEKRANCKDLLSMLESTENPKKKSLNFINNLKTSTKSWVKHLTKDKNSSFEMVFVTKLLQKAIKKPKKIEKFFQSLFELDIYKPKVCIKALTLLHIYMNHCLGIGNYLHCISFIAKANSLWKNSQSPKLQKKFSSTSQSVILNYCEILKSKYEFFNKHQCYWTDFETSDCKVLEKILGFYESLNKFSNFVLNLEDWPKIHKDLLSTLVKEQESLNGCIDKSLLQIFESRLVQEFSSHYQMFINTLHSFYARYPMVSVDLCTNSFSRSRRTIPTVQEKSIIKLPALSKSLILT